MLKIAPSILSADFADLAGAMRTINESGADLVHIDVMDGHFVPNITLGAPVIKHLRPHTSLPLDVHLMIENADRFIDAFVTAGADIITVHAEALPHLHRTLQMIRNAGIRSGVALNPATPLHAISHILPDIDMILLMTVNPGFGGQKFIPQMLEKIRAARELVRQSGRSIDIEIDGGVGLLNAAEVAAAGVDIAVTGSAFFENPDPKAFVTAMKAAGAGMV